MAPVKSEQYGLGDPLMLERIDKLFACGVGEHVKLPQIVVVGDQSSGKSSVLEGLIKKPLPRDSGLCTRFATMIVFRRAIEERIAVSIIPDSKASVEHRSRLEGWKKDNLESLDSEAFVDIMQEVHEIMGLAQSNDTSGQKPTFSRDVLRLEIAGPDQEHLSVIDVPGIFKNTTPGLTTKADIALVREIVLGYMENPRSVMLTVVAANVDVATQEIIELANDIDPEGHRTLGVLTKPDLVDKGAENRVIDLVEGRARKSKLGWHIVRNPGQLELQDATVNRNSLEQRFFTSTKPWSSIVSEKTGIEALRDRLKDVLVGLIRKEFPKVQQEISKKLASAQTLIAKMGRDRSGSAAQTAYLTELATKFQHYVTVALDAKYGSDEMFDENPSLRIAPAVTARAIAFSDDMAHYGKEYQFRIDGQCDNSLAPAAADDDDEKDCGDPSNSIIQTRKQENLDDLADILHEDEVLSSPKQEGIEDWLRSIYQSSRGFELGTFDHAILGVTMKRQSSRWSPLSLGYVSDIVVITHTCITTIMDKICLDSQVRDALSDILFEGLKKRYARAMEHVNFLLEVERNGTPMTYNHYFNENLQKSRKRRIVSTMEPLASPMSREAAFELGDPFSKHPKYVKLSDATANYPMSNTDHLIKDIHDILQSYYKVARKRFVDDVCKQASHYFLINGPDTPLGYFSPLFVNSLTPEELEHIAGEDPRNKRKRSQLSKEITSLTTAKKILTKG